MDRRKFLALSALGVVGFSLLSPALVEPAFASAPPERLVKMVKERVGVDLSAIKTTDKIDIQAPTIAETAAAVPITVQSDIPVDQVEKLWIFVDNNPIPYVLDMSVTPLSGRVFISTRIKMAQTSNVRAILKLKDGSYMMAMKEVKITVGGC